MMESLLQSVIFYDFANLTIYIFVVFNLKTKIRLTFDKIVMAIKWIRITFTKKSKFDEQAILPKRLAFFDEARYHSIGGNSIVYLKNQLMYQPIYHLLYAR